ncbi:SAM-dependent chlorinase/fluorinase [Marivirga harenae]|uniref:SAM hydrolase/SAM-dependent halogenase family protein n=1 Tax=Marivirga harenae TaxID=2010992 RepID=UPI0026E07A2A|nr:SAM-dependent chlorinase/fluorinase [Marivirga harenae]WKV12169.1 SAM-dependent chlorinase/fluorinase [Marivirga harenae]|tara:strand:+ start:300910 stop:301692 length:783 start_codon:yes stop_codon:yes gene_type:complete
MPLITFLSDFGWRDHYVAAVKAKILGEDSSLQVIDISHNITKHDIIHAAHVLKSVYQDFPEGSVHLVAVNSRSEPNEAMIAVEIKKRFFLGSNNGLLSIIRDKHPDKIVKIASTDDLKGNFPAKDILAPAAVKILQSKNLDGTGEEMEVDDFKRYIVPKVKATREIIQGHVVHIDDYGNLITDIQKYDYDILSKGKSVQIKFRNYSLTGVQEHYHESQGGEAFAIFNDQGVLEIGIKQGNASELLGMEYNSMVSVKFGEY